MSPLRLPDGLTAMRGLRELGLSLTAWRPELKAVTFLTRLMVGVARYLHSVLCVA